MTTSGLTTFNPDVNEIIEEAFERASGGQEIRSGYQYRTARRSLNLVLAELANKGLNMWTMESGVIPLVQGQKTYNLPADTVDLVEFVVRQEQVAGQPVDIKVGRIGLNQYATIPNKETRGRPVQIYIDRQRDFPTVTLWPVPENGTYTLVYWRLRRVQDAGSGATTLDIPFRFYNAIISGLAYHLATKMQGMEQRAIALKAVYDEAWQLAADEDREKAALFFMPKVSRV